MLADDYEGDYPIAVEIEGGALRRHTIRGECIKDVVEDYEDLLLVPKPEPEYEYVSIGWVNVYEINPYYIFYDIKEEADNRAATNRISREEMRLLGG